MPWVRKQVASTKSRLNALKTTNFFRFKLTKKKKYVLIHPNCSGLTQIEQKRGIFCLKSRYFSVFNSLNPAYQWDFKKKCVSPVVLSQVLETYSVFRLIIL